MKNLVKIGMIVSLMAFASCAHHKKCGCQTECKEGMQCSLEKKKSCHGDTQAETKPEDAPAEAKK